MPLHNQGTVITTKDVINSIEEVQVHTREVANHSRLTLMTEEDKTITIMARNFMKENKVEILNLLMRRSDFQCIYR